MHPSTLLPPCQELVPDDNHSIVQPTAKLLSSPQERILPEAHAPQSQLRQTSCASPSSNDLPPGANTIDASSSNFIEEAEAQPCGSQVPDLTVHAAHADQKFVINSDQHCAADPHVHANHANDQKFPARAFSSEMAGRAGCVDLNFHFHANHADDQKFPARAFSSEMAGRAGCADRISAVDPADLVDQTLIISGLIDFDDLVDQCSSSSSSSSSSDTGQGAQMSTYSSPSSVNDDPPYNNSSSNTSSNNRLSVDDMMSSIVNDAAVDHRPSKKACFKDPKTTKPTKHSLNSWLKALTRMGVQEAKSLLSIGYSRGARRKCKESFN